MIETFNDREAASETAADYIRAALRRRLHSGAEATLIVSGGTTPARCYANLAVSELPWERIHVTLSDERWVPVKHADSNERMVRDTLLTGAAAVARFLPLYAPARTIEEASRALNDTLRRLPFPFACSLLGMGEDGHFASLFPDAANLEEGIDTDGSVLTLPVTTSASAHRRITLTLAALSRSDEIVLLAFGDAKRQVLDQAVESADRYPVSHLLRQKRAPVRVIWAP